MTQPSIQDMLDFTGKVAVVTGGGSGIGQAICHRLGEAGALVIVADKAAEAAEAVAAEVRATGGKAEAKVTDVRYTAQTQALVDAVLDEHGCLNILVNNAGVMAPSFALDMEEEIWDLVLTTNLRGMFFLSKAAAKPMINAGGGVIINIASMDFLLPSGPLAHYDASKAGVIGLTHALAKEWGPHQVRVVALAPGNIKTPGGAVCGGIMRQMMPLGTTRSVLGRLGEPDDMARAVLFLASPLASYVTGTVLFADGGALRG